MDSMDFLYLMAKIALLWSKFVFIWIGFIFLKNLYQKYVSIITGKRCVGTIVDTERYRMNMYRYLIDIKGEIYYSFDIHKSSFWFKRDVGKKIIVYINSKFDDKTKYGSKKYAYNLLDIKLELLIILYVLVMFNLV